MIASVPACIALILLGAHTLRFGHAGMTVFYAALAVLAFTRQAWVRWVVAGVLVHGLFTWADTTLTFVQMRQALDMPWMRLFWIMAGVITFTSLSALLMIWKGQRFQKDRENGIALAVIFLLTTGLIFLTRTKVPFPVILADRYLPGWGGMQVLFMGLYAVWVGDKMLTKKGSRVMRPRIWSLFSLVFFLQLGLGLSGLDRMLMTGQLHLPVPALILGGPIFRGGGMFMLVLFSVTILVVGPAWCSHLCYIGAWDDQCARKAGMQPARGYPGSKHWGRGIALVIVVAAALGMRLFGVPAFTAVWLAAAYGLLGVGVMVFISRRKGAMAHCTTWCPMGLVANVLGKISPWRIRISSKCTNCMTCSKFCRYGALNEKTIAEREPGLTCTLCGDCVSICPHAAAEYRFPGLAPKHARTVFLILVISLHALFLSVARI